MKPVNLVPREHRRAASGQRPGSAYAVIGALAVVLVMAVAYVTVSNQVKTRTADADAASAQADQLEAQAQQLGSFTNFAAIQQQRLASVAGVASTRFDWERFMRELSRIMPNGSWLQSSNATTASAQDPAAAPAAPAAGTGVPVGPNAQLVGCTPNQSDVARMMVRMRRMYRVTDVKLNESVREASASDSVASPDNCGPLYKFDITLSFESVAPANEAPRGANEVPASLGGGS